MITLRFFKDNEQIFALDTELQPDIKNTCEIKGKVYTVDVVRFVYDVKSSYLRLDVSEQKEHEAS
jgi:hypothetical protein